MTLSCLWQTSACFEGCGFMRIISVWFRDHLSFLRGTFSYHYKNSRMLMKHADVVCFFKDVFWSTSTIYSHSRTKPECQRWKEVKEGKRDVNTRDPILLNWLGKIKSDVLSHQSSLSVFSHLLHFTTFHWSGVQELCLSDLRLRV